MSSPSPRMGIALGLLLSSSLMAGPVPPPEASFVGDAKADKTDATAADNQAKFRRWGGTTGDDKAPLVFPPENRPGRIVRRQASPQEIRDGITARLAFLDAQPDQASRDEAARIRARLALIPANQANFPGDAHPIQFLEYVKSLPDSKQEMVIPPGNKIKVVDQKEMKRLKDNGLPLPQPQYRTTTVTIVTHHLVPTFRVVRTEYPD
jgi:hypothetical protein